MDSPKSFNLSPEIHDYLLRHDEPLDDVQKALIEATEEEVGFLAIMQISPEQGAFMALLARLIGARRYVEVGTFTGYSALTVAQAMPPEGRLLCCDISEEWSAIARRHWEMAGVADRIDLRLAPAAQTLAELPETELFDMAFIDADKQGYRTYYEEILVRLRQNGLILVDNVLWGGNVVDPNVNDADTEAIRAFNDHVAADPRVECSMVAVGDGLSLLRKR